MERNPWPKESFQSDILEDKIKNQEQDRRTIPYNLIKYGKNANQVSLSKSNWSDESAQILEIEFHHI